MAGLKDFAQRFLPGGTVPAENRPEEYEPSREESAVTETKLNVQGMSCGHCKAAVEGELGKLAGVERSDADFEKGTVEVTYDELRVTNDDLRGAVEEAGYTVAG